MKKNAITPPLELVNLCSQLQELGGRALLVGGCVRDALLDADPKDWDLEVFGLMEDEMEPTLKAFGTVNEVGKSFGVIKVVTGSGEDYDIALPRREVKTGDGHQGFEVTTDPTMSLREAAERRDFTINALYYDPLTKEILDPCNGLEDLKQRVLTPVSDRFKEDPLRVLRGMQFAGRFKASASDSFKKMASEVLHSYNELAGERVWGEFEKWAAKSTHPSYGLKVLNETGWIKHFPELDAMKGCPQDVRHHPEGDVWTHTGHCCDALALNPEFRAQKPLERATLMIAMLAHDMGKPKTTQWQDVDGRPRYTAYGHEGAGVEPMESFLKRMRAPSSVARICAPLVREHLVYTAVPKEGPIPKKMMNRLAKRVHPATLEDLCTIMQADQDGRPPLPKGRGVGIKKLQVVAKEMSLYQAPPKALLLGRDLIAVGVAPGTGLGEQLERAFEQQLDGKLATKEDAYRFLGYEPPIEEVTR
jgi:tRNA nucleotidyltransferase (CCA-adding enzyme)